MIARLLQVIRRKRARTATLSCVAAFLIAGLTFGGTSIAVAIGIVALPLIAWAFDNDSGTFLILATLFVISIGIMVLLIGLMAISH